MKCLTKIRIHRAYILFLIFIALPGHAQWKQVGLNDNWINAIEIHDGTVFAGDDNRIYSSSDLSVGWDTLATLDAKIISTMESIENFLFVGMSRGCLFNNCDTTTSIYRSMDSGAMWDSVYASVYGTSIIKEVQPAIVATSEGRLILSDDNGMSWRFIESIETVETFGANSQSLFVSRDDTVLMRSDNLGLSWLRLDDRFSSRIFSIKAKADTVFVLADSVYLSIDNGDTWQIARDGIPTDVKPLRFFMDGNFAFFANADNRVFQTRLDKVTWHEITDNLSIWGHANLFDLVIHDNHLFVCGSTGVWRRPMSEVVSVDNTKTESPNFVLQQNYPNPFNGQTTIGFMISKPGIVKVGIYDILGRRVRRIFHDFVTPGRYKVMFDSKNLASGHYYYKLQQGDSISTKKMTLVK